MAYTPGVILTVVQPDADCPLDRFGPWLAAADADLELRTVRPYAGDPVPSVDEIGDALIVLGGAMHAHADADHPWLPAVRALLAAAVEREVTTLGICLGAQLLAVAAGGRVQVAAPPGREAGIVDIVPRPAVGQDELLGVFAADVPADHPLAGGVILAMPSMHEDAVVDLPREATWLASSHLYPYQAFRIGGHAWGVQFHPEASPELFARWADSHEDVDTAAMLAQFAEHADRIEADGALLAARFVRLAQDQVSSSAASTIR